MPTLTELGYAELRRADLVLDPWRRPARPRRSSTSSTPRCVEIAKTDDMQARMRAISVVVPLQTPAEIGALPATRTSHAQRRA